MPGLQASGFDGNIFKLSLPEWLAKDADGQPIRCDSASDVL